MNRVNYQQRFGDGDFGDSDFDDESKFESFHNCRKKRASRELDQEDGKRTRPEKHRNHRPRSSTDER